MSKGLSNFSLFELSETKDIAEVVEVLPQRIRGEVLMDIPLSLIRPDPDQPRKEKSEEELDDLYKRIVATNGITKPIDVKPDPDDEDKYLIEDGECRWIIYNTRFKKETIPCRVISKSRETHEVRLRQLMANIGNIEMSVVDVANGIREWQQMFDPHKSNKEVALTFGWSQTKVSRTLKVLKAPEALQAHVKSMKLTNINTISRMIDLQKHDPHLFERCLEETLKEGFSQNPETYWNQAFIEATRPEPTQSEHSVRQGESLEQPEPTASQSEKALESPPQERSRSNENEKPERKSEVVKPTKIDVIEKEGIAVLQISYLVGKKELTSDYQLDAAVLAQLKEKLSLRE
ncbi:ParB/RepB/Spo0J family partition protein [Vibrio vulnificus]|nr:ParB/RepB/Spo0J family partition protein [Vibrio vulnificus]MCU8194292.1 ParB/RepB/Spo0J family partition protein [Vibrio vulnificus]